jgi:hypothetical protein
MHRLGLNPSPVGITDSTCTAPSASSHQVRATLEMIARGLQTAPVSMQTHARKDQSAGQAEPATGNLRDPSGSTPKMKAAPLKSETPHEIGGQLL